MNETIPRTIRSHRDNRLVLLCLSLWCLAVPRALAAESVELATDGKALQPIVVAEDAPDRVRQAAETLAHYLGRISGSKFTVTAGDGSKGIAVGRATDFPQTKVAPRFDSQDVARREEYWLQSHEQGLRLFGATELAVEHAVWDLLYRLGYRQFFPGKVWEVVPTERQITVELDDFQRPDYLSRRIWYGYGTWDYNVEPYRQWCARNRCVPGIGLNTGHAYDGVVRAARSEFEEHPEYWPLLDGKRKPIGNPKPCLGNPEVRRLFVKHALRELEKNPELDSLSMDPSDGGGWCECDRCAKLGSITDQAVALANEVAVAVQAEYPGTLVGMYAYNYHSPPPEISVHPQVVVSVATAFIKGGLSLDEIISGWSARGATLGIREYYSVNVWDRDQPGHARGGNLEYLRRTIPDFHAQGARFMSSESSDNWGPNGLGYYLASRMLWDIDEAERIEERVEDFLSRAFGSAQEPMRQFYQQLDGSQPHLVVDDQLGRMFRALDQARSLANTSEIRARVDQLALYAHYCSLYHRYSTTNGPARQEAFEALIRHAYRMRTTMLIHTKALYRDLVRRDKTVTIPDNAQWNVAQEDNPWKSSEPFTDEEVARILRDGIARHTLVKLDFTPAEYSSNLLPAATALEFPDNLPAGDFGAGRGTQVFHTYVTKTPATLKLNITGGLIAHYRDRGNVRVELSKLGGSSETGQRETQVASDRSVPPDGTERTILLQVSEPGLYRITINDGHDRTRVTWPADQPMTVASSVGDPMTSSYHRWMAYFYVPRGTQTIGFFGGDHGEFRDSQDRPQFRFNGRERNFYSVEVPPGEDGKVWQVRDVRGDLRLLTVPPCFATTPQGLLLPNETVERDANATASPGGDDRPLEGSAEAFLGEPRMEMQQLFPNERFPNVVVALDGTVLATWGNKSVRARRSEDGGKTWGNEITLAESGFQGGGTTVDETTGDILAFVEDHHPPAPLTLYRSQDQGKTWRPEEVTIHPDSNGNLPSMHMNDHGITLRHGAYKGRLLRPARYYGKRNGRDQWPHHYTTAIYSDDRGQTWHTSDPFPENGTGEAAVAELSDGRIYYNSRVHWDQRPQNTRRRAAWSDDGGQSWKDWQIVEVLPDGHQQRSYGCMGGVVRLPVAGQDILIFSNIDTARASRERVTVWASFNGGKTWPIKRLVYDGPSAYSSLAAGRPQTPSEGWIYLHFEGGPDGGSQIARFNLTWLLAGEPTEDGNVPKEFASLLHP